MCWSENIQEMPGKCNGAAHTGYKSEIHLNILKQADSGGCNKAIYNKMDQCYGSPLGQLYVDEYRWYQVQLRVKSIDQLT